MPLNLPHLDRSIPVVTDDFKPTLPFHGWWQKVVRSIQTAFNQLEELVLDIEAAIVAAGIAVDAAAAAQTSADAAQAAADDATGLTSVVNSGVDVNPLSATDAGSDATIIIGAHNRLYPNGSSVPVNAGNLTGRAYSTEYWVFYDDPTRAGGAVTYQSTTTELDAAQAGDRHLVGKITTPAAAAPNTDGVFKKYPGLDGLEP